MILLFDPQPPFLRWYKVTDGQCAKGRCRFTPQWASAVRDDLGSGDPPDTVGYFLAHGGEQITDTVTPLSPVSLATLGDTLRFSPESNGLTLKVARRWMAEAPNARHLLFCDTAFYADLPAEASTYAIPYELRKKGIKRYGDSGICHQWAWDQARAHFGASAQRVISIYLGDRSSMAAVKNGRPLETSAGFTTVEGIPSATACGDIDPTIVFQMRATGLSFDEINRLLSEQSGFTGLVGKKCGFPDLLRRQDDVRFARQVYFYSIIKHLGALLPVLGGVDIFVFVSAYLEASRDLIREICQRMGFLGLNDQVWEDGPQDVRTLTVSDSPVQALGLAYRKWTVMAQMARLQQQEISRW